MPDSFQGVAFALFLVSAGLAWWARSIARRIRAPRVLRFLSAAILLVWAVPTLGGWTRLERLPDELAAAPASGRAEALSEGIAAAMRPLFDLALALVAIAVVLGLLAWLYRDRRGPTDAPPRGAPPYR